MNYREQNNVSDFIAAANRLAKHLRSSPQDRDEWLKQVLVELSLVYTFAHQLPETDCGDPESDVTDQFDVSLAERNAIASNLTSIFGESRWYACVFPPSEFPPPDDSVGCGDLADIYGDIVPGLRAWEKNEDRFLPEIIWGWKAVSFKTHWGVHATQAMSILHWVAFDKGL